MVLALSFGCGVGASGTEVPVASDASFASDAGADAGTSIERDGGAVIAPALDDVDLAAFSLAAEATTVGDENEDLWPGYDFGDVPLYLVRRDAQGTNVRGYLVQRDDIRRWDEDLDALGDQPFDILLPVDGVERLAVAYSDRNWEEDPTDPKYFGFVVHEAFHHYQWLEWRDVVCFVQDIEGYPLDAANVALSLLEHEVLLAGIRGGDPRTALMRFRAVRAERAASPAMFVRGNNFVRCMDEAQEQIEGTAAYLERRFVRAAGRPASAALDIEYVLTEAPTNVRFYLAFDRFYATGAAVGELIDAATDHDWRPTCERGAGPTGWIDDALGPAPDRAPLVAAAKADHDFATLEARAGALLR